MAKQSQAKAKSKRPPEILTQVHYDAIDGALRTLGDLPGVIEAAEICDVDCAEYRQMADYFRDKLTRIKDHFFPGGRPGK